MISLTDEYQNNQGGQAKDLKVIASCGKNLSRSPLVEVSFGKGKGKLVLSQLLTQGRLSRNIWKTKLYDIRYDVVAVQLMLNIIVSCEETF
jgi:hypothetical protein